MELRLGLASKMKTIISSVAHVLEMTVMRFHLLRQGLSYVV